MRSLALALLILVAPAVSVAATAQSAPHRVLILGDSLTEGYGVSKEDSFPSVLQEELKKDGHSNVQIINAGISGSTTASGLSRLKWGLKAKPDILILALGGNDGLRGLNPDETKKNLTEIVSLARKSGLQVIIAGMKAPPNYGAAYTKKFERVFREVAREQKAKLMPFLLEGVAGETQLNQADGIHPNEKGQKKVAQNVKKYLEPLL